MDDSAVDRKQLIDGITRYSAEHSEPAELCEYESGEALLANVKLSEIDIIFLDIFMGEMNGMDTARAIRKQNSACQIVFVTTSSDFAVESYDVNAFYYIVKPYTYECIENVMEKHRECKQRLARYIMVKEGREWTKVMVSDILYADYSNHYVQIHTDEAIISTYAKFPEIEAKLLMFAEFTTCYRCIVVNMDKIKKVDDLFFFMCNGEYVPINRKNAKEIKAYYMDYIFRALESDNINYV